MIRLFEKDEQSFSTLGLGVLADCYKCEVTNELNGEYELTLEYPMSGIHFDDLKEDRIIVCKPDRYSDEQPFRIYSISKPLNRQVKVKAAHISYDLNYYPVREVSGTGLNSTLSAIPSACIIAQPFSFENNTGIDITDQVFSSSKIKSLRNLFYSSKSSNNEKSIIETFGCEIVPDKFTLKVYPKGTLGANNGVTFRYGKNITELTQETDGSTRITGVFPLYSRESSNRIDAPKTFQDAYVVTGKTPVLNDVNNSNWLTTDDDDTSSNNFITMINVWAHGQMSSPFRLVSTTNHPNTNRPELNGHYLLYDSSNGIIDVTDHIDDIDPETGERIYKPYYSLSNLEYTATYKNVDLIDDNSNGIIYIGDRETEEHQKILILDLTDRFDSETAPSKEELRAEAEKYIKDNNIGDATISVTVAFLLASKSSEFKQFINAERINLGDTITVIHDELGVSDTLRIQSITYEVVEDKYVSVGVGDPRPTLVKSLIRTNDKLSYLRNDRNFVAQPQVADVVKDGSNNIAGFTEEQLNMLATARISAPGVIEGSSRYIDKLIAQLLIADNAYIKDTLVAGTVVVKGTITAEDGEFNGTVSVSGDRQSSINKLHVGNMSYSTIDGNTINSNIVKSNKLHLNGFQGTLPTIELESGNDTYVRDVSLDSVSGQTTYYGWHSLAPITGNPNAEKIVTTTGTPYDGSTAYYWSTKGFYQNVYSYDPYGYTINSDTDFEVESLSGTVQKLVTFTKSVTATRNMVDHTIDCIVTVASSDALAENITIQVDFELWCDYINFQETAYCTISNGGSTTGVTVIKMANPNDILIPTSTVITGQNPVTMTLTVNESGTPIVSINNNFGPKESNKYSLGRGSRLWSDVYANNTSIISSDLRLKKDVSYDLDKYDALFDKLKPVTYKYKDGESGRTHVGLIAQDVKLAMDEVGISSEDFAGYVKYLEDEKNKNPKEEDYMYAIRYGEFISLCIHKIQQLEARVKELENKEGS